MNHTTEAIATLDTSRAACTEILHFPARVLVIEADHLMSASACTVLEELSDVSEVVDDHPHDHHGAPSAAL